MQDLKFDLANNLANVNVSGFNEICLMGKCWILKALDRETARPMGETDRRLFSSEMGQLQNTGVETDIAVLNEAFFLFSQIMARLLCPGGVTSLLTLKIN